MFRYLRSLFDISFVPKLFQKLMEQILSGCEGCFNSIDDVIVFGKDRNEHDRRLAKAQRTGDAQR